MLESWQKAYLNEKNIKKGSLEYKRLMKVFREEIKEINKEKLSGVYGLK